MHQPDINIVIVSWSGGGGFGTIWEGERRLNKLPQIITKIMICVEDVVRVTMPFL